MCGRFTQQRPASELAEIFGAEPLLDDPGARYNVAPTDEASVVVQREDRRAITAYRWGLIPHWAKDAKIGSRMFNARAETITASPAFRDAFVRKRCLVPVDSFYEWKREGKVRQPYRIVRRDGRPLALAGPVGRLARPGRPRPSAARSRSSPRPRTRRWPTCTTGCPSSSTRTPGTAGSTRRQRTAASCSVLLVPNERVELEIYAGRAASMTSDATGPSSSSRWSMPPPATVRSMAG